MFARRVVVAVLGLLFVGGAFHSVEGTQARWNAMEAPPVLGRDEATLTLFPAIGADLQRGFYGQTASRSGAWWVHEFGSITSHVGAFENREVRVGIAGGGDKESFGIQGFYHREQDTDGRLDDEENRFRASRRDIESDRYGFILSGVRKMDGLTVDAFASLGYEDSRRDLFLAHVAGSDTTWQEITTSGVLTPAWSLGGRVAGSLHGGELVAWFQWSQRRARETIERFSGFDEPLEGFDLDVDNYDAVIGWIGPLSEADLFVIGVGGEYEESLRIRSEISYPVMRDRDIQWSAYFFAGAEKRLRPWLVARGGFRQDFSSRRSEELRVASNGDRHYNDSRRDDFGSYPNLEAGIGIERGRFRADVHLDVSRLLDDPVKNASLQYAF
jgi:hypothetical protein